MTLQDELDCAARENRIVVREERRRKREARLYPLVGAIVIFAWLFGMLLIGATR